MMRTTILSLMAALTWLLVSCSDDEATTITGVRKIENADSLFTECRLGDKVVLVGEHFDGLESVTINGQRCDYNTAYLTDHSIICTVPSNTKTVAMDSSLPPQFEVTTSHGSATYPFYVLSPTPSISRFYADYGYADDGTLTLNGSQLVHLAGANFYDIVSIYVTPSLYADESQRQVVDQYMVNDEASLIHMLMPAKIFSEGLFVVECRQGSASLPFSVVASGENDQSDSTLPVLGNEDGDIDIFE